APAGNCVQKCQQWMRQANEDDAKDPLELLGCALVEFTNLDLRDDPRWEAGFQRIRDVLFRNGLIVDFNGVISSALSDTAAESSKGGKTVPTHFGQAQVAVARLDPLPAAQSTMKSTVLFLAANPDGVTRLAL